MKKTIKIDPQSTVTVIGYCSLNKKLLLEKLIREGPLSLITLRGEYILVIKNNSEVYIITSSYGVCQYYYTVYKNKLFYDETVLNVIKKSCLLWSWNWRALADVTQLDKLIENDTLHSHIQRVPPRSVLHFKNGKLKISSLSWEELHPSFEATPEDALTAFNDETKRCLTEKVVVSMSGGFDSRVILSSVLRNGSMPLLLTMGFWNSTDVIISKQIAADLNLPLVHVKLALDDYLQHGSRIVALTNGTKTAYHWHTFIYPYKAKLGRDCSFFVGSNGEFARSHYADVGVLARMANMMTPLSLWCFWKYKLRYIFNKEELKGLRPEFAKEFAKEQQYNRMHRLMQLYGGRLLSRLDRVFLEQHVKNFISNGLQLYADTVIWKAPFLSREWINALWNLPRGWKLGSNWHRYAIAKNYPRLLHFPERGTVGGMSYKAPPLYWCPTGQRTRFVSFAKYSEWFQSDSIIEFIIEHASLLSELIEPETITSILIEHAKKGNRIHTVAFLLTMIFWLKHLKDV